jgi:hypothetical protein
LKDALNDDDVDDVERDKRIHVSSIVDALKSNDVFLPPPESKKRGTVATTPAQKANWQTWQESAKQVVEINLSQPHAEELVELRAWEIIEEMIKIHQSNDGPEVDVLRAHCEGTSDHQRLRDRPKEAA